MPGIKTASVPQPAAESTVKLKVGKSEWDSALQVQVTGDVAEPEFHQCRIVAESLATEQLKTIITPLPAHLYKGYRQNLKKKYQVLDTLFPTTLIEFRTPTKTILLTSREFLSLASAHTSASPPPLDFSEIAKQQVEKYVKELGNPVVYLTLADGDEILGEKIVIELFAKTCPKSTEHFLKLLERYVGVKLKRVVEGGWAEFGDILDESGHPVREPILEDENFIHSHEAYTLSYISPCAHQNTTPFFITLAPVPTFDRRFVVFGRVLFGTGVFGRVQGAKGEGKIAEAGIWKGVG
ncbi:hypothetical protein SpCBS45565_g05329 [Spizellomyces sp. 'palustris']|nr:hypothetical protein SpCBS45565_g05329 [Spizellomyces sp. 'palustris']